MVQTLLLQVVAFYLKTFSYEMVDFKIGFEFGFDELP